LTSPVPRARGQPTVRACPVQTALATLQRARVPWPRPGQVALAGWTCTPEGVTTFKGRESRTFPGPYPSIVKAADFE